MHEGDSNRLNLILDVMQMCTLLKLGNHLGSQRARCIQKILTGRTEYTPMGNANLKLPNEKQPVATKKIGRFHDKAATNAHSIKRKNEFDFGNGLKCTVICTELYLDRHCCLGALISSLFICRNRMIVFSLVLNCKIINTSVKWVQVELFTNRFLGFPAAER